MQDALCLFRYVKRIGQSSNPFFCVSDGEVKITGIDTFHL